MDIYAELLECFYRIALALECINRHLYQIVTLMKEQKKQKEKEASTNKEDQ